MGLMLISSLAGIAQNQIGLGLGAAATAAVSVISVANTFGRFLFPVRFLTNSAESKP